MLVVAGEKRCHVLPCFVQMRVAPVQLTMGKLLNIKSFQLIIIFMVIFCIMCNFITRGFLYVAGTKYSYS